MTQQNIRDYNNTQYSIAEGAAIISELNARTSHAINGYNSIAELGVKVKAIYDDKAISPLAVVEGYYSIPTIDPSKTKLVQIAEEISNGADFKLDKSTLIIFTVIYGDAIVKGTLRGVLEGSYGINGSSIASTDLVLFSEVTLNSTGVDSSSSDIIDLGNIGTTEIHTHLANLSDMDAVDVQPLALGFTIFEAVQNGVPSQWVYYGNSGLVGENYYQPIQSDLKPLVLATGTLPTYQQVIDASTIQQALFASGNKMGDDGTKLVMISQDDNSVITVQNGQITINSDKLILQGSDSVGFTGRVLRVNSDGEAVWEDLLGETSTRAYRGDRGKSAYDHSELTEGNPHQVTKEEVGLGNVDNVSDENKPISASVQSALNAFQTKFKNISSPANEVNMSNQMMDMYNWTSPTDQIDFNLTNLQAGGRAVIRILKDTLGNPQTVTVNGSENFRICSRQNWNDSEIMELFIFATSTTAFEWFYNVKQK
jgi:hypothetical protein